MARAKQQTTETVLGYVLVGHDGCERVTVPGVPGQWLPGEPVDPRRFGVDAIELGALIDAADAGDMFQATEVEPWVEDDTPEGAVEADAAADAETTTEE